jgi:hypothetical protein
MVMFGSAVRMEWCVLRLVWDAGRRFPERGYGMAEVWGECMTGMHIFGTSEGEGKVWGFWDGRWRRLGIRMGKSDTRVGWLCGGWEIRE